MPQRPGLKRFKHLLSFKVIRIWLFIPQNIHTCIFFHIGCTLNTKYRLYTPPALSPTKRGMGRVGKQPKYTKFTLTQNTQRSIRHETLNVDTLIWSAPMPECRGD